MNITLTDEQIEALQKGEDITISAPCKKVERWEPKGGGWYINLLGKVFKGSSSENSSENSRKFGLEYQTKEQVEKARNLIRSHNRQIAWLMENDDGWVADWKDRSQPKYFIDYNNWENRWGFSSQHNVKVINTLYMSLNNAKKLAELLNDGIVEF